MVREANYIEMTVINHCDKLYIRHLRLNPPGIHVNKTYMSVLST